MTTGLICIVAALSAAAVVFTVLLLLPQQGKEASGGRGADGGVAVETPGGIVTVRKVGRTTAVLIRDDIHDHWEGAGGIDLPLLPVEVTRRERPELYAEYLSPDTSAIRKYEIADDLYAEGYTLPWIGGLHAQYKRELKEALEAGGDSRTILERTPVDLTPRPGGDAPATLHIDDSLRHVPVPDMDGGDGRPEENQE